jgi:hypothetical protein
MGICASSGGSSEPAYSLEFGETTTGKENPVYGEVQTHVTKSLEIITALKNFRGCGDLVRDAITTPSAENEERAWAAVVPSVDILKEFYEFSLALEKALQRLIPALCAPGLPESDLHDNQALTKQLAQIFDFTLRFDDMKMTNPAIQNDFSYYRRILNRIKLSNKREAGITVGDELANSMSLFFAYPTPMMNSFIKVTNALCSNGGVSNDSLSRLLARLANSCHQLVTDASKRLTPEDVMLCLRSMTGAVILYDHINPRGAFHKKSPVNIRGIITALRTPPAGAEKTDSLVNGLRFNTVHLNEEETPGNIKQMLA